MMPRLRQVSSISIMPDALPEKATAQDLPFDYAALNNQIAAQTNAMVTAGTVSPAAAAGGGLLGGLIIAAVDASIDANRNSKLRDMLADQNFDAPAIFSDALQNAMTGIGMPVNFATGTRKNRDLFTSANSFQTLKIVQRSTSGS